MHQDHSAFLKAIREEVPHTLFTRVHSALEQARARRQRMRHMVREFSAGVSLLSFAGLVVSVQSFAAAATTSGFTAYASLMLSDSAVVAGNLSSFLLGLAESLPSMQGTLALALASVFLVSLRNAVTYGLQARTPQTVIRTA